nr:formylglycine-generating enzyme family protein [Spirochaeta sp.]
ATAQAEQAELARLASARRQEMQRLAEDARSEDPDILIATIERLEAVIEEVETEYEAAWRRTRSEITASFQPRLAELSNQEPVWESDEEFNARITQERNTLRGEQTRRINSAQQEMESQEEQQTAEIRSQFEDALSTLRRSTWTLKGSDVALEIGEYDRNTRQWPFIVSSTKEWLPLEGYQVVKDFNGENDPPAAAMELNDAVQAGALAGEITWNIERDEENDRYLVVAQSARVRNIVSNGIVESEYPRQNVSAFPPRDRVAEAESIVGTVRVILSGFSGPVTILVDGEEATTVASDAVTPQLQIEEGERIVVASDGVGSIRRVSTSIRAGATIALRVQGLPGIYVEGGTFRMGTSSGGGSDERPVHTVSLDPFIIMQTEVTFTEYDRFAGATGADRPDDEGWGRGARPVINVSWYDAVRYANWLSEQNGLTPAYRINGNNVTWNRSADGWRLPTEAEWEYAARGGQDARDTTYAGSNDADDVAWYDRNSSGRTRPVGQKQANELGLNDMSGNVWEWCWDWYDNDYYDDSPQNDPTGPVSGSYRVFRGGSWFLDASGTRVAYRCGNSPGYSSDNRGFRLVRD